MGKTVSKRNMVQAGLLERYGPGRGAGRHSLPKVLTCQEHHLPMPDGYCLVCEELLAETNDDGVEVDE